MWVVALFSVALVFFVWTMAIFNELEDVIERKKRYVEDTMRIEIDSKIRLAKIEHKLFQDELEELRKSVSEKHDAKKAETCDYINANQISLIRTRLSALETKLYLHTVQDAHDGAGIVDEEDDESPAVSVDEKVEKEDKKDENESL